MRVQRAVRGGAVVAGWVAGWLLDARRALQLISHACHTLYGELHVHVWVLLVVTTAVHVNA